MNGRNFRTLALVAVLAGGGWLLWHYLQPTPLPPWLASGNGRLEATEVDVATKLAGRLREVNAWEGDQVKVDQVLARLDADDPRAQLRSAQAQASQAHVSITEARENVRSAASQLELARATLARSESLVQRGFITKDKLDQDRTKVQTAQASLEAAQARVDEAAHGAEAAQARSASVQVTVNDTDIKAPRNGRVLYRLAEPGEVLGAGGKVLTLLDLSDVYMTFYLPTDKAGQVSLGAEARIVLDALPNQPIPARVTFVSPQSQFTPKTVETHTEREKLMFRIKVRIPPEWLAAHPKLINPGSPGVAYVRLEVPGQGAAPAAWPAFLQVK